MALSNIFREPMRELTETAVGLSIPAIWFVGAYTLADHEIAVNGLAPGFSYCGAMILLISLFFIATFTMLVIFILFAIAIHQLGESICDFLEKQGTYLRPRRRR